MGVDAGGFECLPAAAESLVCRRDGEEVAEKADAAMSVTEEVLNSCSGPLDVVGRDAVGVQVARRPVDEHERGTRPSLLVQIRMVVTRGHDDDPVDPAVAERADQLAFTVRILVAAPGEDEHAAFAGRVLDGAMKCGRERVRHVLEHESDRLRLAAESS